MNALLFFLIFFSSQKTLKGTAKWRENNPDKVKEYFRKYFETHTFCDVCDKMYPKSEEVAHVDSGYHQAFVIR